MSGCERVSAHALVPAPGSTPASQGVWGNSNVSPVIFTFLQPGTESGVAAQVCKKWREHAAQAYTCQDRLNLDYIYRRFDNDDKRALVTATVLRGCANLRRVTVPCCRFYYKEAAYFPLFSNLSQKLEELDLHPASPLCCDELLARENAPQISVTPTLKKLSTTSVSLHGGAIDVIAAKFPKLEELYCMGRTSLIYLLCKLSLKSLVVFQEQMEPLNTTLHCGYWEGAEKVGCLSLRTVWIGNCEIRAHQTELMIKMLPHLERLEFRHCQCEHDPFSAREEGFTFLNDLLKRSPDSPNDFFDLDLDAGALSNLRVQLNAASPNRGQPQPSPVAALDAPAGEKQKEGKKE